MRLRGGQFGSQTLSSHELESARWFNEDPVSPRRYEEPTMAQKATYGNCSVPFPGFRTGFVDTPESREARTWQRTERSKWYEPVRERLEPRPDTGRSTGGAPGNPPPD